MHLPAHTFPIGSPSRLLVVAAACILLAPSFQVSAEATRRDPSAPETLAVDGVAGERVLVHLRVRGTELHSDGTIGATDGRGSADADLAIGESAALYVSVTGETTDGANPSALCMAGTGYPAKDDEPAARKKALVEGAHLWWAEVRALPAKMGTIALEVKWDHESWERSGHPVRIAGDTRRLVLNEGESHVLDFLAQKQSEPSGCYRNVSIDIVAEMQEDPALAGRTIGYDLWFKHTDAAGNVTLRRFQAAGHQGERVDFRFAPMRFPIRGALLDDGSTLESILESAGGVRGRARADGTIRLDVGLTRWIGAAAPGDPRTGGYGAGGQKLFAVGPGETISMVLPSPGEAPGYGYDDRTGAARTNRAETESKRPGPPRLVQVDNRDFYAGHKDELILTASFVK